MGFADDADYRDYLERLLELAPRHRVQLHGWCLLPQAVWLLLTPADAAGMSALLQALARLHSRRWRDRALPQGADAPRWQGRFRSAVLQPGGWALDALCALEQAPALDGAGLNPDSWRWSSLAHHVGRSAQPGLRELPALWSLGNTPYAREAEYLRLLQGGRGGAVWPQLQRALQAGLALGDAGFLDALQQQLGRPLRPARRGRPPRAAQPGRVQAASICPH